MTRRIRGYVCCGVPMVVTATRRPTNRLVVRYRQCSLCKSRVITEERVSSVRKPDNSDNASGGTPPANPTV